MENNNVSLSQDEVDKLLGIIPHSQDTDQNKNQKTYTYEKIFTEEQLNKIRKHCTSFCSEFLTDLKAKFGEPKVRKLTLTAVDQVSSEEFFDKVNNNEFLYKLGIENAHMYVKLDSFLFGALAGLQMDTKHKINLFQSEVLRHFVIAIMAETLSRRNKAEVKSESLFEKDTSSLAKNDCGILLTINWNEDLRSFGVEKVFISKEFFEQIK